jgi:hypothetical protein
MTEMSTDTFRGEQLYPAREERGMSEVEQGRHLRNKDHLRQLLLFDGLGYKFMRFSDIDSLFNCMGRGYIFIEAKYYKGRMPDGQRELLEGLVKDCTRTFGGVAKQSVAILVEHDIEAKDGDVLLRDCLVRYIYMHPKYKWREPKAKLTVGEFCDMYMGSVLNLKPEDLKQAQ